MGLFIVVYDIGKRLGLRSIDTGDIRYITSSHLSSQYTPLHRRDNWFGVSHTWGHTLLHSQHYRHTYCTRSIAITAPDPTRFTSPVHIALAAWHNLGIHDALAACCFSNKVAV